MIWPSPAEFQIVDICRSSFSEEWASFGPRTAHSAVLLALFHSRTVPKPNNDRRGVQSCNIRWVRSLVKPCTEKLRLRAYDREVSCLVSTLATAGCIVWPSDKGETYKKVLGVLKWTARKYFNALADCGGRAPSLRSIVAGTVQLSKQTEFWQCGSRLRQRSGLFSVPVSAFSTQHGRQGTWATRCLTRSHRRAGGPCRRLRCLDRGISCRACTGSTGLAFSNLLRCVS
jgi:hypothetical protein